MPAQWVSQGVDCGHRRIGKSLACQHGAQQHLVSSLTVIPLRYSQSYAARQQRQGLPGECIRYRVFLVPRCVGLDRMHHGIHTGHRGNSRWQAQRQVGIQYRHIRQ